MTVYVPEIGGLLPVYVADRYEGFRVKTFAELTDAELDGYLEANVAAVRDVVNHVGGVDAALANHLVMGPVILARAGLAFAAKIHGSALEYTVKPEPERFLPYAREGLDAAAGVLVGSRHTAESLWEAVSDPDLPARTRLGPPGVDTELFRPLADEARQGRLAELAATVAAADSGGGGAFARDVRAAADAIRHLAAASGPRVVLVGKDDRLQGRRPAARCLAARSRLEPRRPPARGRLRRVRRGRSSASGPRWPAGTSSTLASSPPRDACSRAGRRDRSGC